MLLAGIVLAFVALVVWVNGSVGHWLIDVLVAVLPWDEDSIARVLWRLAVAVLLVGSVGRLATEGISGS